MGIFGPSKDEVWRQLSHEIGAEFVEGRFWSGNRVQAYIAPWTITLDTHTVSTGHSHITYTRMRAPYVNPDGLRFTLYRKGLFSELGKLLGMQDIEVGDPDFDEAFIVKGTDEFKVRELFDDPQVRALALAQPTIHLSVKDDEGWFGAKFPKGVDELHFQVVGILKDGPQLKALFDLFAAILDRLCEMGAGRKEEPGVRL
ncbi:hypothetical protein [Singulisphaera acidiphila]|uniref:DUF3137 domain-containing protein n=1 Tax=Singulisphaera acidiphila (strain ATCC BAA-1392 / DSM 18658 / VKM B-2454 / MOB10) TaxID=886293 RepID=L0DG04_SINAD|nr:hypothetical protein [Singulisphaera acidiphila]AGA28192.1 hypothetical protein Sinac_3966 [Singulisphaera acidiphila DSM 18658]